MTKFLKLFKRRLKPLPPLEPLRDSEGKYIKQNYVMRRAKMMRQGR